MKMTKIRTTQEVVISDARIGFKRNAGSDQLFTKLTL